MIKTTLTSVDGVTVVPLPSVIAEALSLASGVEVELAVHSGELIVATKLKRRYALADLLADWDSSEPLTAEEREWIEAPAVGREIL